MHHQGQQLVVEEEGWANSTQQQAQQDKPPLAGKKAQDQEGEEGTLRLTNDNQVLAKSINPINVLWSKSGAKLKGLSFKLLVV